MPIMDGYEATSKIRQFLYENNIKQPLIFAVTGHNERQYVIKALNSGMNKVLSKPIKGEIINSIVQILGYPQLID